MKRSEQKLVDTSAIAVSPLLKGLYRLIQPGVEQLLGIKALNQIYEESRDKNSSAGDFSERVLNLLGISFEMPQETITILQEIKGPVVFVANHPFGGIEAMLLFRLMSQIRSDYRIIGNFLLEKIEELRDNLILVDPFESPASVQANLAPLKALIGYLKQGGMVGVFPSGQVSAFELKSGRIKELDWNPSIAKIIQKTQASVVPIFFEGRNSLLFQMAGIIHPRLRTALLVREFVNPNCKKISYQVGKIITPEKIATIQDPVALNHYLKSKTYLLGARNQKPIFSWQRLKNWMRQPPRNTAPVISETPVERLRYELNTLPETQKLIEQTHFQLWCFQAQQCPLLLREIARLREITFRNAGEGTGHSLDLDDFDNWYHHLIIWDTIKSCIVGAYRIGKTDEIIKTHGVSGLYTSTLFKITPDLFTKLTPALEMGRSFIREEYQKSFAPLMLLWMGIGQFILKEPKYRYLFGPVSLSNDFHPLSKDFIVSFLTDHNIGGEFTQFVRPIHPYKISRRTKRDFYNAFVINNLDEVSRIVEEIEGSQLHIPVLLRHYLKLGGKLIAFNVDPDFNNVLDALIYVDLPNANQSILKKYLGGQEALQSYLAYHQENRNPNEPQSNITTTI